MAKSAQAIAESIAAASSSGKVVEGTFATNMATHEMELKEHVEDNNHEIKMQELAIMKTEAEA
eukprot:2794287-Rhodomonas_salina.1